MKSPAPLLLTALAMAWLSATVQAAGTSYRIEVAGLACPFCAYGIEKRLNAIEGVEHLETNIKEGTVTVIMKDGVPLDDVTAEQAVKDAGFTLKGFEHVAPDGGR